MKDTKDSWEQKSWEYAASSHERMKRSLVLAAKVGADAHAEYLIKRLAELEAKYPQLKENKEQK